MNETGRGKFRRGNSRFRGNGRGNLNKRKANIKDETPKPIQKTIEYPTIPAPFKGWNLYFPNESYNKTKNSAQNVELVSKYLRKTINISQRKTEIESRGSFVLDIKELSNDDEITSKWPKLTTDLHEKPLNVLQICGLAMHHLLSEEEQKEWENDRNEGNIQQMPIIPIVFARIVNLEPILLLKNLKSNCFGKLVSVKGTVVRMSNINPMCIQMAFKCCSCFETQIVEFVNGISSIPNKCSSDTCKGKIFQNELNSNLTKTIDWQTIKLQELLIDDEKDTARIPRTVECELTRDLVDSCVPGDVVIVNGIVKTKSEGQDGRKKAQQCTYELFIDVISLTNCKGSGNASRTTNHVGQDFSVRDLYAIQKIQSEKNLFRLIVASLCPAIYGHEMVKAGLVLSLFGGTGKFVDDKNRLPVRGDPHILIIGDPGLGKSQLLRACANVAPRSVYVCGNTTTSSGLTVTVCKGSSGSDYALEAGALVLADQGCCCIDEFDKMTTQHQALLEAMEQQCISIAKAGIVCSLPARASIVAAANPVGGHYDPSKSIAENLKLGNALLSRFDLIFILLDKPDKQWDQMLSNHIMAMHFGVASSSHGLVETQSTDGATSLKEKLKFENGETIDRIPHQLLRKYVGYARTYVKCELSVEAIDILRGFYLQLRSRSRSSDTTPVTTRQLESLVRLAEARAKVDLREVVSAQDALDVVEIMKCTLIDVYSTDNDVLMMNSSLGTTPSSGRSKNKKFVAALDKIAERTGNPLFTVQQMREVARELNMDLRKFENMIDTLNNENYLLKKGPKTYKLQTA